MRFLKLLALFIFFAFLVPMAVAGAWWSSVDHPASWRSANWSSVGLLPDPELSPEAAIYVLTARTGGFKGAFAVHSWIVLKDASARRYTRFEKVGWGSPIRQDAYDADAAWYSNRPWTVAALRGQDAIDALPDVRRAIASYPFSERGDYRIWPGPNSNSFVAHVLRQVPALDAVLPPNAVGRDYLANGWFAIDRDGRDVHFSIRGLFGVSAGLRSGFEIHLLGQTVGFAVMRPALKIPAIGEIGP